MQKKDVCLWHHLCCCPVLESVNTMQRGDDFMMQFHG
jgi:hypothetical protein